MNVDSSKSIKREDSKSMLADFDLEQSIKDSIFEMDKERQENEGLILPDRFIEIHNCPEMVALLFSIKDYLKELFKLESK